MAVELRRIGAPTSEVESAVGSSDLEMTIKQLDGGAHAKHQIKAVDQLLGNQQARNRRRENGFQSREIAPQTWWGSFGVKRQPCTGGIGSYAMREGLRGRAARSGCAR